MWSVAVIITLSILCGVLAWRWLRRRKQALRAAQQVERLRTKLASLAESHDALSRVHKMQAEEETRMFSFLHELSATLASDLSPSKLHRRIVKGVVEVVKAKGGALYLHESETRQLVPTRLTQHCPPLIPLPPEIVDQIGSGSAQLRSYLRLRSINDTEGPLGEVFQTNRPLVLADLRAHPSFASIKPVPGRALAVMIAPLNYGPKRLGVLAAARTASRGAFTNHDFAVFTSLAEQSAFALGNAMMTRAAAEEQRLREDLARASEIQRVLLPSAPPSVPGFALAASFQPAQVVGGDYYDFIPLGESHLGLAIADVSGKGLPAGLVMATCRGLLRSGAPYHRSPAAALREVNRLLFGDIRQDMFVSLAYAILDVTTGEVTLARAGHDPPFLFRHATSSIEELKPPGLALGVDKGNVFDRATREQTFQLQPGDRLLFYTDGVTEALDARGLHEFGPARLATAFREAALRQLPAEELIEAIRQEVTTFSHGARQHDDITLLVIERLPEATPAAA